MYKTGFIGCGSMGSAIASAVAETVGAEEILAADRDGAKAEALAGTLGVLVGTNAEIARECAYIFLAVKPQGMEEMLMPLRGILAERGEGFVLVTMAAGLSTSDIARMAGGDYPIIRIMPNTPVAIGAGMTLVCASEQVGGETLDEFEKLMRASGRLDRIPEEWIDAGCAVSGCGPAFVYLFLEALADGAVACGMPRERALAYACQTAVGAASMVRETGRDPRELAEAVCSPGGATLEGVLALAEGGMEDIVAGAVGAAYRRTLELRDRNEER